MTDAITSTARFAESDFQVGRVLNRTSKVLSRNFLPFFIVTAVAYLPTVALNKSTPDPATVTWIDVALPIVAFFLLLVLSMLAQAVVLYGAFQDMRGRQVSLAESVRVGLRRFLPVIGMAVAMMVLVIVGFALLIVPGFILLTMWFVGTPVCVVEQRGPLASLGRSQQLTKGHRWKVFGLLLVLLVISATVTPVIDSVLPEIGGAALAFVVGLIWNGVWGAFYAIAAVVTYHDLRVAKEGIDIEQIAAVFD
jgi:uncharacterized membrane protein